MNARENPYRELAQERKAVALAGVLRRAGATPERVRVLWNESWVLAAEAAGVNHPGAGTRARVVEILESWERCPHDGNNRATSGSTISPENENGNFKNHPQKEGS